MEKTRRKKVSKSFSLCNGRTEGDVEVKVEREVFVYRAVAWTAEEKRRKKSQKNQPRVAFFSSPLRLAPGQWKKTRVQTREGNNS